jgi:hypothetical protein
MFMLMHTGVCRSIVELPPLGLFLPRLAFLPLLCWFPPLPVDALWLLEECVLVLALLAACRISPAYSFLTSRDAALDVELAPLPVDVLLPVLLSSPLSRFCCCRTCDANTALAMRRDLSTKSFRILLVSTRMLFSTKQWAKIQKYQSEREKRVR